ncbi:MAG: ParB/RepB/Spo0J family partition protein [Candidatus Bathyarchaeia archaeon]
MVSRINRYVESVSAYDNIEISLIISPPNPIRGCVTNVAQLIESIREHGLLEPILVRPKKEKFEIIAGNRRFETCRQLKYKRIKCIVQDLDDKSAFEVALTENIQRKTLDPIQEAFAFKRYCEQLGWGGQSELARRIGKSQEYISHRIALLKLPNGVKDALREDRITVTAAGEILGLKGDEQQSEALKTITERKMNTKELRRVVRTMNSINTMHLNVQKTNSSEIRTENRPEEILSESVLIMRIALIRLDDIISKVKSEKFRQYLISKRLVLHNLISDFVLESQSNHWEEDTFDRILLAQ